jgi:glycosyltransferase involved in cell wall biosynthesis
MAERSTRPRVLFAIGSLGNGGSERQLSELLSRIHPEHVDAHLILAVDSGPNPRRRLVEEAGVRMYTIGHVPSPRRMVRQLITFRRWIAITRAVRPDVAYPWLDEAAFYLTSVARALGIPTVVARRNVSGADLEAQRVSARWLFPRVERRATMITANSEAVLRQAIRRGNQESRVLLVRNGHPAVPPSPAPAGERVEIGYLARFSHEKGHRRLLDVAERISTARSWRITLAGDGLLRPEIAGEARRRGLEDRVRLVGPVPDGRSFWADQHIALLLSDHEGSPNALMEAAFAGRPLVATRVGGIPELCDEPAGRFFDPADTVGIAGALDELIADSALREERGAAAHRAVSERFAMDASVDGHLRAIELALSIHRGRLWSGR